MEVEYIFYEINSACMYGWYLEGGVSDIHVYNFCKKCKLFYVIEWMFLLLVERQFKAFQLNIDRSNVFSYFHSYLEAEFWEFLLLCLPEAAR